MKLYQVPNKVAINAELGLLLRKTLGRGGTQIGETTARYLVRYNKMGTKVPYGFVKKVSEYFPRHEGDNLDQDGRDGGKVSNGYIAWLLWGGDEGRDWSQGIVLREVGK